VTSPFPDHFSERADAYAAHRPTYPDDLFDFVASAAPRRNRAWECAAGSGQATLGLAARFERVVATDASAAQIARAPAHPRVEYRVAAADRSGLEDSSVDLVAVAQALHWFDAPAFYLEARRVLASDGVLAAWCYGTARLDDGALDSAFRRFHYCVLAAHWPLERRAVESGYRTLSFPLREIAGSPEFEIAADWTLGDLLGYVRTWSAVRSYESACGEAPIGELERALAGSWGGAESRRRVVWPVHVRIGRFRETGGEGSP